jgi:hypothetical protein
MESTPKLGRISGAEFGRGLQVWPLKLTKYKLTEKYVKISSSSNTREARYCI